MYVLGCLDHTDGTDTTTLEHVVDRVVDTLATRGRVGVIRYDATIADGTHAPRAQGGDVIYDLGADGDWNATGTGITVQEAIDSLASTCDYALVVDVPKLRFPRIDISGDDDSDPQVLATIDRPSELADIDLLEELHATEPHETLESLVSRVKRSADADKAGAIATFTGRVRAKEDDDDVRTEYLEFEKYEGVADERMAALERELESRDGVHQVELYHKTGLVEDGEDIVFVVVLAGHREEAFETVQDGINRLKAEVPLFKKEVTVDDEFWVHDRP